jgi:hypothetical protein
MLLSFRICYGYILKLEQDTGGELSVSLMHLFSARNRDLHGGDFSFVV